MGISNLRITQPSLRYLSAQVWGCKAVLLSLLNERVLTQGKAGPVRRIYARGPEVPIRWTSGPSRPFTRSGPWSRSSSLRVLTHWFVPYRGSSFFLVDDWSWWLLRAPLLTQTAWSRAWAVTEVSMMAGHQTCCILKSAVQGNCRLLKRKGSRLKATVVGCYPGVCTGILWDIPLCTSIL